MTKKPYLLTAEDIEDFSLEDAEEQLLYTRYLIRRETQEYRILKYLHLLDMLERHIEVLQKSASATIPQRETD